MNPQLGIIIFFFGEIIPLPLRSVTDPVLCRSSSSSEIDEDAAR